MADGCFFFNGDLLGDEDDLSLVADDDGFASVVSSSSGSGGC